MRRWLWIPAGAALALCALPSIAIATQMSWASIPGTHPLDVLMAHDDSGDLLGGIRIEPLASEFGEWCPNGLAVGPASQGPGVGRALIVAECDKAVANGVAQGAGLERASLSAV